MQITLADSFRYQASALLLSSESNLFDACHSLPLWNNELAYPER